MQLDTAAAWNREYARQGIPSSHREQPSGVVSWALNNLQYVSEGTPLAAVDLGCGTGRNSAAMAAAGLAVAAIDISEVAIATARDRYGALPVEFHLGSVTDPLPFPAGSFDLAADVFVYFHQLAEADRRRYRQEIHRVLRPGGVVLVSLATDGDGYYASCGSVPGWQEISGARLTWDPVAEVGNILLSQDELLAEFADLFDLQMLWRKHKHGYMHGKRYLRETVATMWKRQR